MSNTRHAKPGSEPSQEAFCSSAEYDRGLLANLVAQRCELLDDPNDAELLFALQHASWQRGGLKKFAEELCAAYPEQIATRSMQRFGFKPGQVYSTEQVRKVRSEVPMGEERFTLKGELKAFEELCPDELEGGRERQSRPASYPAADFLSTCREAAQRLHEYLEQLCLDPKTCLSEGQPWFFPRLAETLREYFSARASEAKTALVHTKVTEHVFEMIEYALAGNCMVLLEGPPRMGKSFSAQAWCRMNPGRARYVQVPSTNDDIGFFRKIAEAVGVSSALSLKGVQLRERVEKTLQSAKLMLLLDESHYLWPQNNRREALPGRINWIMTALVNYGVPVVLLATPQFTANKKITVKKTGWACDQLEGRIACSVILDEELPETDLAAVARAAYPTGNADAIVMLVGYAQRSLSYLAGIEQVLRRARHEAKREGRAEANLRDISSVVKQQLAILDAQEAGNQAGELTGAPKRNGIVRTNPAVDGRNATPFIVSSPC